MTIKRIQFLFLPIFLTAIACEKSSIPLFIQKSDGFNHFTKVQVTEHTTIAELLTLANQVDDSCLNLDDYQMLPAKKLANGDIWTYNHITAPSHTVKDFLCKHRADYITFIQVQR